MPPFGRVLVVDDDPLVGQTLARMLTVAGYTVAVVTSAAAGLEEARRATPDAVIVDFRMPVATGLSFLSDVRREAALRDLPIAVVTGDHFLNERTLSELRALGATVRYKPLLMDDLVALVHALTGRDRAAS